MNLTPSKEHYIKTIHFLSSDNRGVHITEIAAKLDVTKASVCIAMNALQQDAFIYRGEHRLVFLTEKGRNHACKLTEKYEIIKRFLLETLHVDNEIAEQDACALEHVVSSELLMRMQTAIGPDCPDSK